MRKHARGASLFCLPLALADRGPSGQTALAQEVARPREGIRRALVGVEGEGVHQVAAGAVAHPPAQVHPAKSATNLARGTEGPGPIGRLVGVARERGVKKLAGLVLAENTPMRALGFGPPRAAEDGVVQVEMGLG